MATLRQLALSGVWGDKIRRILLRETQQGYRNSSIKRTGLLRFLTRVAILTSHIYAVDLITGGEDSQSCVATIFRFVADGSCDRKDPHLNDRRVCRFIIIGDAQHY